MAHHKSAKKRIITNEKARLKNRVIKKSIRTVTKKLKKLTDQATAVKEADKLFSMLDKAAKKGVLHSKNVSRKKSRISKFVNKLNVQ